MLHLPIFVYGTLKRGERRESNWPHLPERIEPATVPGELHDFGPYPGLTPGQHTVLGELWFIASDHMHRTLQVLDAIEDYNGREDDLYDRVTITSTVLSTNHQLKAHTYLFKQPLPEESQRIRPDEQGLVVWAADARS